MPTPGKVTVCFYQTRAWYGWPTRWATRRAGQPLSDVPTHVGVAWAGPLTGTPRYAEAVCKGVRLLGHAPTAELFRVVTVDVPDLVALTRFLANQNGEPYDFGALAFDLIGLGLPRWVKLQDERDDRWDCSRLVTAALRAGGCPLTETFVPESPNDLYLTLAPDRPTEAARGGFAPAPEDVAGYVAAYDDMHRRMTP
jgi:hypothetical protein